MNREKALDLLKIYNKEEYHIKQGLMVESIMRYIVSENNYDVDFFCIVGLLHDVDYEIAPLEHCYKCVELLKEIDASDELVHAICSHGYNICTNIEPTHFMEKVLYACDELTGIISSLINMRPSHNAQGMEVSTLKKKFKDKTFARGCSRDIIKKGCEMLEWNLDELFEKSIKAIEINEENIEKEIKNLQKI